MWLTLINTMSAGSKNAFAPPALTGAKNASPPPIRESVNHVINANSLSFESRSTLE